MKLGIMQPYFLPYIGYYQLISAVDVFIVYDKIKYTKKGWINRNRFLLNGKDAVFSLPLRNGSDFLDVVERELATDFNREKLLNQFQGAYQRAPHFAQTFPLLEQIVRHDDRNLFRFIHHSILTVCDHLCLTADIRVSSGIDVDPELTGADKVLALCEALGADTYFNPIGGTDLYSKADFRAHGIDLRFVKSKPLEYVQFGAEFVPWLSIVDVLMFNPLESVREFASHTYELV